MSDPTKFPSFNLYIYVWLFSFFPQLLVGDYFWPRNPKNISKTSWKSRKKIPGSLLNLAPFHPPHPSNSQKTPPQPQPKNSIKRKTPNILSPKTFHLVKLDTTKTCQNSKKTFFPLKLFARKYFDPSLGYSVYCSFCFYLVLAGNFLMGFSGLGKRSF